jgi:hypothetical protein
MLFGGMNYVNLPWTGATATSRLKRIEISQPFPPRAALQPVFAFATDNPTSGQPHPIYSTQIKLNT